MTTTITSAVNPAPTNSETRINHACTTEIREGIEEEQQLHHEAPIEPPWAGIGRSINAAAFWILATFLLVPVVTGHIYKFLWWLLTGYSMDFPVLYALGLLTAIAFLKYYDTRNRVFIVVESNTAVLLTGDIPSSAKRESDDASEKTVRSSWKVGEGFHFLYPTDQKLATLPIESDFTVPIKKFLVSLEDKTRGRKVDMLVSGNATFETDPENLLRLVRIDKDENVRKDQLKQDLEPLIKRIIEEECRIAETEEHLLDALRETSVRINKRIAISIQHRYFGIKLKKFTLGNVDHTEKNEKARDTAGAMVTLSAAAADMMNTVNLGVDKDKRMTPPDAMQMALVVGGIKEVDRKEQELGISPATLAALAPIIGMIFGAKQPATEQSPQQTEHPETPTNTQPPTSTE